MRNNWSFCGAPALTLLAVGLLGACTSLVGLDADYVMGPDEGEEAGAPSASSGRAGDPERGGAGPRGGESSPDVDASAMPTSARPSCAGLNPTCGAQGNSDCCASAVVPGGTYNRMNRVSAPATVAAFDLDVYEVTVGRFRRFVQAQQGTQVAPPIIGSGGAKANGLGGWRAEWISSLPVDGDALVSKIKCNGTSWTDAPGPNENRPIGCVSWPIAFAFCVWDGGRLPSEAEWNFAAAGGSEQRKYPWAGPMAGQTIDDTRAVYGGDAMSTSQDVGSKSPFGDGRWGHADLSGNAWEWTLDYFEEPLPTPCADCVGLNPASSFRVVRGGGFRSNGDESATDYHYGTNPTNSNRIAQYGIRCARDVAIVP